MATDIKMKTLLKYRRALTLISQQYDRVSVDEMKESDGFCLQEIRVVKIARTVLGFPDNLNHDEAITDAGKDFAMNLAEAIEEEDNA